MAGNTNQNRQLTPTQKQILDNRALQKKRDKQNLVILISILVIVLVALIATTTIVIWKSKSGSASTASGKTVNGVELKTPGDLKYGIVIGKDGVNKPTEGVNDVSFFFSYGCPGCLDTEHNIADLINNDVKAGKFNIIMYPVGTHGLPWTFVAGDAAMTVSREQPEVFMKFHKALIDFAYGIMFKDQASMQAQGNGTILADPNGSLAEVKRIAKESGVKEDLIKNFKDVNAAKKVMDEHDNSWIAAVKPLAGEQIGTPMFVKNSDELIDSSKFIDVPKEKSEELNKLKTSDPAKYQAEVQKILGEADQKMVDYFGKK